MAKQKFHEERSEEELEVELTDQEMTNCSMLMANRLREIEKVEEEKKAAVDHFNDRIKRKRGEVAELKDWVRNRSRPRMVKTRIVFDDDAMVVTVWREDTGEKVRSRDWTYNERQRLLPLEDQGK